MAGKNFTESSKSQSQTLLEDFNGETKGWIYQEGTVTYIAEEKDTHGKALICSHVYYPLVKCNELPAPSSGYKSFAYKNAQKSEYKCMKTEHQKAIKLGLNDKISVLVDTCGHYRRPNPTDVDIDINNVHEMLHDTTKPCNNDADLK